MPTDHRIAKPRLFISHATTDGAFAKAVEQEVRRVFADGIDVFCTSSPGAIGVGIDWLGEVESRLANAQAVIAIITPVSIERSWLWFELGATWLKTRAKECTILPLCAPEISMADLPSPLDRLQALNMGKAEDLSLMMRSLIGQFGFGSIKSFKASNIIKNIPKYKDVKLAHADAQARALYNGKYSGYAPDELEEVIDDLFFKRELSSRRNWNMADTDGIENGRLIHFREVDRSLSLPPGTAQELLVVVGVRHNLVPQLLTENVVRFHYREDHMVVSPGGR